MPDHSTMKGVFYVSEKFKAVDFFPEFPYNAESGCGIDVVQADGVPYRFFVGMSLYKSPDTGLQKVFRHSDFCPHFCFVCNSPVFPTTGCALEFARNVPAPSVLNEQLL